MTITAKYDGRCRVCSGQIHAGEKIEWSKSSGARHIDCAGKSSSARSSDDDGYDYDAPIPGCGECARLGRMCDRCLHDER